MNRTAAQIKERRQALHLTQSQLAKDIGVSQALVSKWETTGDIPKESIDNLFDRLGLGVSTEELFGSEEHAKGWHNYLQDLIDDQFSPNDSVSKDELQDDGVAHVLWPLKQATAPMPSPPTYTHGNYANKLDGYSFQCDGERFVFTKFLRSVLQNNENISMALNQLFIDDQITEHAQEALWDLQQSYAWSLASAELRDELKEQSGEYAQSLLSLPRESRFEAELEKAWLEAYRESRSPSSELKPLVWTLPMFMEIVTHGYEADSSFDVSSMVQAGEAPDIFIREIMALQQATLQTVSALQKKVERLEALLATQQ